MTPPDSGEREVNLEVVKSALRSMDGCGPMMLAHDEIRVRATNDLLFALPGLVAEVERARAAVFLPLSLAQRILAALEDFSSRDFRLAELKALAAELRERLPK